MVFSRCSNGIVVIVIALHFIEGVQMQSEYCSLCQNHIACNNDGSFGSVCSSDVRIPKMTSKRRAIILMAHNKQRDAIAMGKVRGYEPATRMAKMQWNEELANLAELNVKRCLLEHDTCRNTDGFRYVGQNMGAAVETGTYPDIDFNLKDLTLKWYSEKNVTGMEYINLFRKRNDGIEIGHFTQLITDRAAFVGCAASLFKSEELDGVNTLLFVCNYSVTNIDDEAVYTAGSTASECETGTDEEYTGLCNINEKYIAT